MNRPAESHPEAIADRTLDRLVDGALSPDEERQLLAALEEAPCGWRRCALAFIEAHTWRREMTAVAMPGLDQSQDNRLERAEQPCAAVRLSAPPGRARLSRHYAAFAVAASVLFAFVAGWVMPDLRRAGHLSPNPGVVAEAQADGPVRAQSVPQVAGPGAAPPALAGWPEVIDPAQVVALMTQAADGSPRPVLVPLLDEREIGRLAGGVAEAGIGPALPDVVRRQLERAGYRVEQRRRYAPLPLDGGQRMIVPIEDTQIVPVQFRVY